MVIWLFVYILHQQTNRMPNETTFSEDLHKVMTHRETRYNGCLIYQTKGGYEWSRKVYATIQEAKQAVDNAILSLQKSIKP